MAKRYDDPQERALDEETNGYSDDPFGGQPEDTRGKSGADSAKNGKKRGGLARLKRILIIIAVIAVLIAAFVLFLLIRHRRNDGARYAQELSAALGGSMSSAEHAAKISLHGQSENSYVNASIPTNSYVADSPRTCKIQGVHLPEWSIVCAADGETLSSVTYYHYELLEKNTFGTERKSYIAPSSVSAGTALEQAEETLGLEPFSISYIIGNTQVREYRYCYEDAETKDLTCYLITAKYDQQGKLTDVTDARIDMIGSLLKPLK